MSNRTDIYKFLYLQDGDKWYPGYDYENMLTAENQLQSLYRFVGPGVLNGWDVYKLADYRDDQLSLINGYLENSDSEMGQRLTLMNLNFTNVCDVATTANITLSGIQTIDGVLLVAGNKVLVKNQTSASQNGVYSVASGAWTRHATLSSSSDYDANFLVYVSDGTTNTQTLWIGAVPTTGFTLNTTALYFDNVFKQCVKVTAGNGIVQYYAAETLKTNYFRYTYVDSFYVWAEPSLCLVQDGICAITSPLPPDEEYDTISDAVYLATVECTYDAVYTSFPIISEIVYEDRRNDLTNLQGAFQEALRKAFYKHKHLGTTGNPSQILLSTELILNCLNSDSNTSIPSSTIFIINNQDGTNFTGNFADYGIPDVKLNNISLASTEYRIDSSLSPRKIYLKNSILSSDLLQIILPLSIQKSLIFIDINGNLLSGNISTENNIYLSDGSTETIDNGDGTTTTRYKRFSWSRSRYLDPVISINDVVIDSINYFVDSQGYLYFRQSYYSINYQTYSNLKFVLEAIGREIQSKLNGKRIENINAASFNRGKLDQTRIKNLDHIGDFRYKAPLSIIPSKLLLSQGNRTTYYPENSNDLQFDTTLYSVGKSLNLGYFSASKRGLYTAPTISLSLNSYWNVDKGRPKTIQDNILIPESENYFKSSYMLTKEGKIFYTSNSGKNWYLYKAPSNVSNVPLFVNSFSIATDKVEATENSVIKYAYSTYQFAATNDGVYMANVADKFTQNDWSWTKIKNIFDSNNANLSSISNVNQVLEMSLKKTEIIEEQPDRISYDRYIYAAVSGTNPGLYYGVANSKNLIRTFTGQIKGIYWIKDGANKNNIIWWTDYEAFITRTAKFYEDSTGSYWQFPLTLSLSYLTSAVPAATISNLSATYNNGAGTLTNNSTLTAINIDGVSLSVGNKVLVKNQTNNVQNGIYTVTTVGSGSVAWVLTRDGSIVYSGSKLVAVSGGTLNASSSWYLEPQASYNLGVDPIIFDYHVFRIYSTTTPSYTATRSVINCVEQRKAQSLINNEIYYQYLIGHTDGLAVSTDSDIYPTYKDLFWEAQYQGGINSLLSEYSNSEGIIYAATDRGMYASTEFLWTNLNVNTDVGVAKYPWVRTSTMYYDTDEISIYKSDTLEEVTDFSALFGYQSIQFNTARNIGAEFLYERTYTDFYTDPWTDTNANVIVYINDQPSVIPFYTDPAIGLVRFVSSVKKADINNVKISISRFEAFISNIGVNPHLESYNNLVRSANPIAYLSKSSGPSELVVYINQAIDSSLKTLIFDDGTNVERVTVGKIQSTTTSHTITLAYSRASVGSRITFEPRTTANTGTAIYSVSDAWSLGIEDKLYKIQNQHSYHYNSVNNANHILMDLKAESIIPTLFDITPAALPGIEDKRGLKNMILAQNVAGGTLFDTFNSVSAAWTGIVPTITDRSTNPGAVFAILNANQNGSNTRIATDKGVWKYDGIRWKQESSLDNANRIYYLKSTTDVNYIAGGDTGLWQYNNGWSYNIAYPQIQYDYTSGSWGSGTFEAYGKSDGLAFVYRSSPTSTFTSDNFNLVDQHNVYGLYKDKFLKLVDDGNGGVKQTEIDSLYLLSDVGIFGVANGAASGTFNSILVGRNMMATTKPSDVNYFYKAFRALPTPPATKTPVPLFILTDKGILKVRNWRWCDPSDSAGNDFFVESRYLSDKACYSYALRTESSTPGKSKIFIGTSDGVYRSFDEGNNFEKCERIEGGSVVVYDLAIFSSTYSSITSDVIIACTERGMFYSIDDGDTWYRCGDLTNEGYNPVSFDFNAKTSLKFSENISSGGWLAQTFITNTTGTVIKKAAVYLERLEIDSALYDYSVANNTLSAYLYTVDEFGSPEFLVDTSPTVINPSSIEYPRFVNFDFNYSLAAFNLPMAIVVLETVASGGISVMTWTKSNGLNQY
jgi:hypothetical protein